MTEVKATPISNLKVDDSILLNEKRQMTLASILNFAIEQTRPNQENLNTNILANVNLTLTIASRRVSASGGKDC